jgi:hypothetical protein
MPRARIRKALRLPPVNGSPAVFRRSSRVACYVPSIATIPVFRHSGMFLVGIQLHGHLALARAWIPTKNMPE